MKQVMFLWEKIEHTSGFLVNEKPGLRKAEIPINLKVGPLTCLNKKNMYLVGGWTNPFEKYESKWESSPNNGENKKCSKPSPRYSTGIETSKQAQISHEKKERKKTPTFHYTGCWIGILTMGYYTPYIAG